MTGLARAGGCLAQAKHLLNALAHPLTDRVTGMAGCPSIDCRSPIGGVLRHVRRHVALPQIGNKAGDIVGLVGSQCDPVMPLACARKLMPPLGALPVASFAHRRRPIILRDRGCPRSRPRIAALSERGRGPVIRNMGDRRFDPASISQQCLSRLRPECLHLVSRFVRPEQECGGSGFLDSGIS
jgi:hypothetical protein